MRQAHRLVHFSTQQDTPQPLGIPLNKPTYHQEILDTTATAGTDLRDQDMTAVTLEGTSDDQTVEDHPQETLVDQVDISLEVMMVTVAMAALLATLTTTIQDEYPRNLTPTHKPFSHGEKGPSGIKTNSLSSPRSLITMIGQSPFALKLSTKG